MDFLNGKIRPMYLKYLAAAFDSARYLRYIGLFDC